ncbi:anti-sigma factor family protein [Aquihabitans daechungensis]|uniref:anti-sigma factor family protein n=1 Tax=Aquihabitans daechungensis TaxID=1052257 RepID=UPI003BA0C817
MRSERVRDRATPISPSCEALADLLPGVVDGTTTLDRADRRHVERCLRCQAELAQYRKLLRAMQGLRAATVPEPTGLVTDVIAHLEAAGERRAVRAALTGRKVAYIGGIAAAATAAGAGAAIVLVSRGRKGRLPLAG